MKKLNQKGFSPVEIIILILVLGLLGFAGYTVWQNQKSNKTETSTNTSQATKVETEKPKLSEYKDAELGFSLNYPAEWGTATLVNGPFSKFQSGKYKQLNFSKATNVSVNFVTGSYSSPLDACGYDDPVQNAQHSQEATQASVIGWEGDDIKRYIAPQGAAPSVYKVNKVAGDTGSGWTEISKKDRVLVYKAIDKPENRYKSGDGDGCSPVTQAQADEANAFLSFYHYAVNYSTNKVLGVNGQFDARKGDDAPTRSQLTEVLNSIK